ncbi:uncharacterized protein LOC111466261 isoform X2 [Cucurbita maxima]|uniref:Uncharacterized protein LOC111466261 isoform X2 n=1 Tax=Cucurbita maxima TaxID=3661 RepID=A0A6J1HPV6_CUCMA|nr:uncharacterized protein LOC111466261 isoform X2 [Cucurbita maxima]
MRGDTCTVDGVGRASINRGETSGLKSASFKFPIKIQTFEFRSSFKKKEERRKMPKCGCGSACNCDLNNCSCKHDAAPIMKQNLSGGCKCGANCSCDPCNC